MRVESPSGHGLTERIRVLVNKKENTWCDALVDSRSHIKYSPVFPLRGGVRWTVSRMTCRTTPTLTATRTSSSWNATTTVCGWTTIGRNLTMGGIRTTSSYSVSETVFFFLSATLHVAVFLFRIVQIFLPAAEHLPYFFELQSDVFALLVGNELAFPSDWN